MNSIIFSQFHWDYYIYVSLLEFITGPGNMVTCPSFPEILYDKKPVTYINTTVPLLRKIFKNIMRANGKANLKFEYFAQ